LNTETGLYEFEDFNGDGIVSAGDDREYVRDLNPQFYGGLQNQLTYKGIQLDFLFQFVKQLNYDAASMIGMPGAGNNQTMDVVNHWQEPGDTGPYQMLSTGINELAVDAYYKYIESDAVITDASYVRLKNISLTYTLPSAWTKGSQLRLSFQGQNLLTFTKYKGADPEFKYAGFLPPLKIFTAGIQLTL
jgi:hypothetical protein